VIYIDTSAAMKLVRPEVHSDDLSDWLRERRHDTVLSSVLIEVELMRATRRSAPEKLARAAAVLRGIAAVTLAPPVVSRASDYADANLRSPDAIHLATAEHVVTATRKQLDAFVAYDDRLLAAARNVGLPAVAPGST
jgi:predicted nucleic acid-binding protein